MPRQVTDQPIRTKTQRARLEPRRKPYYRRLSDALAIGYRRLNTLPGTWVVRRRDADGSYSEAKLSGVSPDDVVVANGTDILSFDQACARAREALAPSPDEITLAQAAESWAAMKTTETDKPSQKVKVRNTADRIVGAFPEGQKVSTLTAIQIQRWRDAFLEFADPDDADGVRKRRATANRELATFKAICAKAVRDYGLDIAHPWEAVSKFAKAESFGKRVIVLTHAERQRWIANAPDTPTANMIRAALMTGCRSGELVGAHVRDLSGRRLTVSGKTGRRTMVLSASAASFFAGLVDGANDPNRSILLRADGTAWLEDNLIDMVARATVAANLSSPVTASMVSFGKAFRRPFFTCSAVAR